LGRLRFCLIWLEQLVLVVWLGQLALVELELGPWPVVVVMVFEELLGL